MVNSPFVIRLFGPMRVIVRGQPLPHVRTRSVEWLLALLTLRQGRTVDCAWPARTLWPDSEESRARQNLRNNLVELRAALGPEAYRILSPTRSTLSLDLDGADVDLIHLKSGIAAGTEKEGEEARRRAVEAYTGPLLEGCYADWATSERETLAARCLEALEKLAERVEARGEIEEGVRWLRRAEGLDPMRELTVLRLMTALDAMGDHASAMQTYREFRDRLHEAVHASPNPATTDLYAKICSRAHQEAIGGPLRAACGEHARQRETDSARSPGTGSAVGKREDAATRRAPSTHATHRPRGRGGRRA